MLTTISGTGPRRGFEYCRRGAGSVVVTSGGGSAAGDGWSHGAFVGSARAVSPRSSFLSLATVSRSDSSSRSLSISSVAIGSASGSRSGRGGKGIGVVEIAEIHERLLLGRDPIDAFATNLTVEALERFH